TGGKAFHNTNDITGAIKKAVEDAKVTYTIGFYPEDAKWDGQFHKLVLHCNRSAVNIRYRPGYFATSAPPEQTTRRYTDIMQVLRTGVKTDELGFTVNLQAKPPAAVTAQVVIDPTNITLTEQEGKWVGSLKFIAISGNVENGKFDEPKTTLVNMKFPPEVHKAILEKGLTINHTFNLQPDTNQFRFAIMDVPSGALGSLVITSRKQPAPATGSPRVPQ
ncbi:MAG TPA: hypothetical protein VGL72_21350, partial [Bryobacteraceae bacterium]